MPLLPTLSSSELTRLSRGVFGKLIVLALIAVPSIYAGLLTWSNLDATTSLDRVPAAIVNLDEPATVTDANGKKQTVPLGRVVTGELVGNDSSSNLDWSLTDAQKAQEGLEDGTYYAVLTIPKTFSAAATSSADADAARQATMRLETNDATSYLAGNIATVFGAAEIAHKQTRRLGEEDRFAQHSRAASLGVDEQRFVVATIGFPLGNRLTCHALAAQLRACHVVRRIDDDEEREGDEIHPDQNRDRVQQSAQNVGKHGTIPRSVPYRARGAGS